MRLSEAIRIGALIHPQAHGRTVALSAPGEIYATCAIGAACIGAGLKYEDIVYNQYLVYARFDLNKMVVSPIDGREWPLDAVIMNLNDDHRWSRNAIADWIEREVENKGVTCEQATHNENHLAVR